MRADDSGEMPALSIEVEPDDDREARLALVRKMMLALKKDDEHAFEDALEEYVSSVSKPADVSALGDE